MPNLFAPASTMSIPAVPGSYMHYTQEIRCPPGLQENLLKNITINNPQKYPSLGYATRHQFPFSNAMPAEHKN